VDTTSTDHFASLIRPAILQLLGEQERESYRCERDLHHHLTLCLNAVRPLRLGRSDKLLEMEHPTRAKYRWGSSAGFKAGNIDFYFLPATALELNCNYDDRAKISQDLIKLVDPRNSHHEAVYFAYAYKKRGFRSCVEKGFDSALWFFTEDCAAFQLASPLYILVAERTVGDIETTLWEAKVDRPCRGDQFNWTKLRIHQFQVANGHACVTNPALQRPEPSAELSESLYISRSAAEALLRHRLGEAGIPLGSATARCMFEPIIRGGRKICKFGMTPLWDNVLRIIDGKVLRSEFTEWVEKLCESGRSHQRAAHAAWWNGRSLAGQ